MFIDSHAHLDSSDYAADLDAVLVRAQANQVSYIVTVGTDLASSRRAVKLAHEHDVIYASVGIHPHDAEGVKEVDWDALAALLEEDKVVAVGETGLDYYRMRSPAEAQESTFRRQLALACAHDLPVIVHCREAASELLTVLEEDEWQGLTGVLHCFSGDQEISRRALALGFCLSFAGPLTFPKATALRQVAASVPIARLLLETDSPYLAPQAHRGKRNEPAYVTYSARTLAALHHLPLKNVARLTSLNAQLLFGIGEIDSEDIMSYLSLLPEKLARRLKRLRPGTTNTSSRKERCS